MERVALPEDIVHNKVVDFSGSGGGGGGGGGGRGVGRGGRV